MQQSIVEPVLLTIRQFAERYPAWTEPGLRSLVLNAQPRFTARGQRLHGNGLFEAGGILRVGRKVLLDQTAFFAWVRGQQRKSAGAA